MQALINEIMGRVRDGLKNCMCKGGGGAAAVPPPPPEPGPPEPGPPEPATPPPPTPPPSTPPAPDDDAPIAAGTDVQSAGDDQFDSGKVVHIQPGVSSF